MAGFCEGRTGSTLTSLKQQNTAHRTRDSVSLTQARLTNVIRSRSRPMCVAPKPDETSLPQTSSSCLFSQFKATLSTTAQERPLPSSTVAHSRAQFWSDMNEGCNALFVAAVSWGVEVRVRVHSRGRIGEGWRVLRRLQFPTCLRREAGSMLVWTFPMSPLLSCRAHRQQLVFDVVAGDIWLIVMSITDAVANVSCEILPLLSEGRLLTRDTCKTPSSLVCRSFFDGDTVDFLTECAAGGAALHGRSHPLFARSQNRISSVLSEHEVRTVSHIECPGLHGRNGLLSASTASPKSESLEQSGTEAEASMEMSGYVQWRFPQVACHVMRSVVLVTDARIDGRELKLIVLKYGPSSW